MEAVLIPEMATLAERGIYATDVFVRRIVAAMTFEERDALAEAIGDDAVQTFAVRVAAIGGEETIDLRQQRDLLTISLCGMRTSQGSLVVQYDAGVIRGELLTGQGLADAKRRIPAALAECALTAGLPFSPPGRGDDRAIVRLSPRIQAIREDDEDEVA